MLPYRGEPLGDALVVAMPGVGVGHGNLRRSGGPEIMLYEYNCEMFLGQFVSLIARERVPAKKAIESARKLEFWHVIEDHYLAKGWTRRDLERHRAGGMRRPGRA